MVLIFLLIVRKRLSSNDTRDGIFIFLDCRVGKMREPNENKRAILFLIQFAKKIKILVVLSFTAAVLLRKNLVGGGGDDKKERENIKHPWCSAVK